MRTLNNFLASDNAAIKVHYNHDISKLTHQVFAAVGKHIVVAFVVVLQEPASVLDDLGALVSAFRGV